MKLHVYLSLKINWNWLSLRHHNFSAWCYKMVWSLDECVACQDPLCCSGPLGITVTEGMRRVFRLWFSCWISSSCFSYIFTAWVNRMIPKSKLNILSICSLCTGFERKSEIKSLLVLSFPYFIKFRSSMFLFKWYVATSIWSL